VIVKVVVGLDTLKFGSRPLNCAVTVRDPGDICPVGAAPNGVGSTKGVVIDPTSWPPLTDRPTVPKFWVPTKKVTVAAGEWLLMDAGEIAAVNVTGSLYCCVLGDTVTKDTVGAGDTV